LTHLIDEDRDLVGMLNSTKSNYTLFAPINWAFDKIPEDVSKPPSQLMKDVLLYHLSPELLLGPELALMHTIPTLLEESSLGGKPQRIRVSFDHHKMTINQARIITPPIVWLPPSLERFQLT
jgi:uncharacterized surface protein with fasciclin (FAS1) repeats